MGAQCRRFVHVEKFAVSDQLPVRMSVNIFCVTHEWARLHEVIVGSAFYRIPKPLPELRREGVTEALWQKVKAREGMTMEAAMPTEHARCAAQIDAAVRVLETRGVIVHRVAAFEPQDEAFLAEADAESLQFFPRDPLLVAGERVIELTPRDVRRRRERAPLARMLRERFHHAPSVLTMPLPVPPASVADPFPFLEGGDCLVNGAEVLVGVRRGGGNLEGVRWLQRALQGTHRVTPVALAAEYGHLDLALGLVRPGLGIVCSAGLPQGLPPSLRDWDWIEVSPHEARVNMATNGLPLHAGSLLLPSQAGRVADALEARGHEVIRVPFDCITQFGGGLRCWSQPLMRRDPPGRDAAIA